MLTSTFIHTQGVGQATEKALWANGIDTWQSFLSCSQLTISKARQAAIHDTVVESIANLDSGCVEYFARKLPKREHWRALSEFGNRIGYLDIETDGGYYPDAVTIIGLYDGFDMNTYVKGRNLEKFAEDCIHYDAFVTFFGGGFDIPFLIRRFPALASVFGSRLHIDLCPLMRRLGYSGGLKRIEKELNIRRIPETEGLDGYDAVRLWRIFRQGGTNAEDALRLLISYNREDVINMKEILEFAIPKLQEDAGWTGVTSEEHSGQRYELSQAGG